MEDRTDRKRSLVCAMMAGVSLVLGATTAQAEIVQPNDDFEAADPFTGNYGGPIQYGGTMGVSTEQAHTGTQSIKAVASPNEWSNVFAATSGIAPWTELWVRSYVYVGSVTSDGFGGVNDKLSVIGGFGAGGVGVPFNVFIAPNDASGGKLVIEMLANGGGGEGTFRSPNPTFETGADVAYGQWHYIEAHWVNGPGDGDDGFEVFLNDAITPAVSLGFASGFSTTQVVSQVNFGASAASVYYGSGTVYFDNYAIDDANQIGMIPEPASAALLLASGLLIARRRRA